MAGVGRKQMPTPNCWNGSLQPFTFHNLPFRSVQRCGYLHALRILTRDGDPSCSWGYARCWRLISGGSGKRPSVAGGTCPPCGSRSHPNQRARTLHLCSQRRCDRKAGSRSRCEGGPRNAQIPGSPRRCRRSQAVMAGIRNFDAGRRSFDWTLPATGACVE
jgi:hypothetical protein